MFLLLVFLLVSEVEKCFEVGQTSRVVGDIFNAKIP